jgi:hypothetical protein
LEEVVKMSYDEDDMTAPSDWLDENFGDEITEENQSLEEMMHTSQCNCGGELEDFHDDSPDKIYNCEQCSEEYKYCGSCSHYYLANNWICPNDH